MKLINEDKTKAKIDIDNKNKMLIILIGIVVLAIIVVFLLLGIVQEQRKKEEASGIKINGTKISLNIDSVILDNGEVYYPIREFAEKLGYSTYRGEAKYKTEDQDKCYIENEYESVSFFENQNYIYKLDSTKDNKIQKYKDYQISQPVINRNGTLYICEDGLMKACNVNIEHEIQNDKISNINIQTLEKYVQNAASIVAKQGLSLPNNQSFENQKALLKNWIVVTDENNKYGIIDGSGNEILGIKYSQIEYDQYTDSFFITDTFGKVGVWKIENNTVIAKVSNAYDSIELIDKDKQLYLVSSNKQYGVINFDGQTLLAVEYDAIGVDTSKFNVDNPYILFEQLVPVKKNNKWRILSLEGTQIPGEYDQIGCVATNKGNVENAIIIQEYGLIVVGNDGMYGLVNWKGSTVQECILSLVYYSDADGTRKPYIDYVESDTTKTVDLIKLLETNGSFPRYIPEEDIFSEV